MDSCGNPSLRSWVESANDPASDFQIQNLPYGVFETDAHSGSSVGVAIGEWILDLRRCGLVEANDLAPVMALGLADRRGLRLAVSCLLREGSSDRARAGRALVPRSEVRMRLPCRIGGYTDFYAGIHHARRVGAMFRPANPLLPNYRWIPIGYNGRASSVVCSGHRIHRPNGQIVDGEGGEPRLAPTRRLDFELELGAFVGTGNAMGAPIVLGEAEHHLFGLVLLNDWSARDVQAWEYQPLGPFLSKGFATSISPWVVTMEALAAYRVPMARPEGDPAPLPYLDDAEDRACGGLDIRLEAWLQTNRMRERGLAPERISATNATELYWSFGQMIAHHTVAGCNLQGGDLLGSGTISGPGEGECGSLLELTEGGRRPLGLPGGETRSFLEGGDVVTLRAYCERPGLARIGFGECSGTVID